MTRVGQYSLLVGWSTWAVLLFLSLASLLCCMSAHNSLMGRLLTTRYSAGYPIISHFTQHHQATFGAFNLGGTNKTGQVRGRGY